MDDNTITLIVTILSSAALSSLVQFLITLFFSRKDKLKDIEAEQKAIREEIKELREENARDQIILIRRDIRRFADEIRNGVKHSPESFRQMVIECDQYDKYCSTHDNFSNGLTIIASELIRSEHRKLFMEGGNQDETA